MHIINVVFDILVLPHGCCSLYVLSNQSAVVWKNTHRISDNHLLSRFFLSLVCSLSNLLYYDLGVYVRTQFNLVRMEKSAFFLSSIFLSTSRLSDHFPCCVTVGLFWAAAGKEFREDASWQKEACKTLPCGHCSMTVGMPLHLQRLWLQNREFSQAKKRILTSFWLWRTTVRTC